MSTSTPATSSAGPAQPAIRAWMWCVFASLVVTKLILVSHEEIVVWGEDDTGFAQSAANLYWKGGYSQYLFDRQPVYPLFIAATTYLGVPTRLATELVWITACAILIRAIWACGVRPIAAVAAGSLCLMLPATLVVFARLIQDSLYGTLVLVFVPSLVAAIVTPSPRSRWRWASLAACTGALAANTRPESVLVYMTLAGGLAVIAFSWRRDLSDRPRALNRTLAAFVMPLVATLALTHSIRLANFALIDAYITEDLTLPGMAKLYDALLAIPPETADAHVPIKRDVREKAYAASPTFATLQPWLDGPKRPLQFQVPTKVYTGVKNEYGAWTVWALRDAAWKSHPQGFASAGEIDRFYSQCAAELREAMREGRLARRWVPISFIPPEWGDILRHLPGASRRIWTHVVDQDYMRPRSRIVDEWIRRNFDAVAGRRATASLLTEGQDATGADWINHRSVARMDRLKSRLGNAYHWVMIGSAAAAACGLPLGIWCVRHRWIGEGGMILGFLSLVFVFGRTAMLSLMDASGIPTEHRLTFPIMPMVVILGVIGASCIVAGAIGATRDRRSGVKRPPHSPR